MEGVSILAVAWFNDIAKEISICSQASHLAVGECHQTTSLHQTGGLHMDICTRKNW